MSEKAWTVECEVHFRKGKAGRKQLQPGPGAPVVPAGRVPRVARLLALAHRLEGLVRQGAVKHYAELARLGQVTRARLSQITNLLLLAPDIQEAILFLPRTLRGRDPVRLADLQPVALTPDWKKQRWMWQQMRPSSPGPTETA